MRRLLRRLRSTVAQLDSRHRWIAPLLLIAALVWAAWFVGVRTRDPPTHEHSLGVVAQARGSKPKINANRIAGDRCPQCVNGPHVMRYRPGAGLRVDMVVSVHPRLFPVPRCGQASVELVISGTEKFWEQHAALGPDVLTRIAVGWDRYTEIEPPKGVTPRWKGSPALVAFYAGDPQAPLHPGFYTDPELVNAYQNTVKAFPATRPLGLRTQIYNWAGPSSAPHQYGLHLHFRANWVQRRGFGSCYVLIPSLLANGTFAGTQNALRALLRREHVSPAIEAEAQPPSFGRIALVSHGSVSLGDTTPAPTDSEAIFVATGGTAQQRAKRFAQDSGGELGPVWACEPTEDLAYLSAPGAARFPSTGSFTGNACGAIAVVDAPAARSFRAVFLIVIGVAIALGLEWLLRRLWGQ